MTTPSCDEMQVQSGEPETGGVPGWDVSAATQKGASHTTSGAPNQDAHSWRVLEGPRWVAEQLPEWGSRWASSDGSGDDTTVVLAIART
jgi:hypothetical protein